MVMMSFEVESHLVSNMLRLQGSGELSPWEASSLNLEEVSATSPDLGKVWSSF